MAARSPNRPSDDELRRLYVDERLSSVAIAEQCQVEKITVLRWLRAAGIERRPAGTGLAARGLARPTAEDLQRMLHEEHLGLVGVATRYGVDYTAVGHWCDDYGIPRPTIWQTRRGGKPASEPTEQELCDRIAAGESLRSIERDFDVTRIVLRNRCREYGIDVRRDGWDGGHRLTTADGHRVRSTYELRVDDWLHAHGLAHELEPRYPFDQRYRADFLVQGTFIEVWGVTNNPRYKQRRQWKVEQCARHGLPLIQIGHWQFAKDRRWWKPLENLAAE